jgi:alkaline phosphatase D
MGSADFIFPVNTLTDAGKQPDDSPSPSLRSLAFGSCHKLKYAKERLKTNIWNSILSVTASSTPGPLDAWVWAGDAVYPPSKGIAPVEELQREYQKMKLSPDYAAFTKQAGAVLGSYDDHDYGGNDYGKRMPYKRERSDMFYDFLGLPKPLPHQSQSVREGVYYTASWGQPPRSQVKLIVLDTRYFRDDHCIMPSLATKLPVLGAGIAAAIRWMVAGLAPTSWCDEGRTVLGEAQWSWLKAELESSQASLHVIVSSIQVLTTNPAMESWGHYPSEQRRLLNMLQSKRPGLVILSGDVHHAEILNVSGIVEVTSSGLTHDCSSPIYGFLCEPILKSFDQNRRSPSDFYPGRNFGHLVVDWESRTFHVDVHALRDVDPDRPIDTVSTPVLTTDPMSLDDMATAAHQAYLSDLSPCMDGHLQQLVASILLIVLTVSISAILSRSQVKEQSTKS